MLSYFGIGGSGRSGGGPGQGGKELLEFLEGIVAREYSTVCGRAV